MILFAAMDNARSPSPSPDDRSDARVRRDQALRRVGHMRRWLIGSSAALTAGFAVLLAEVAHGRSSHPNPRATSAAARPNAQTQPALPADASPGDLGLQSPAQAPQPAQSTPAPQSSPAPSDSSGGGGGPAVSGGS